MTAVRLRKPTIVDVSDIVRLVEPAVRQQRLLPRTRLTVTTSLRDYTVAESGDGVVGVASIALVDAGLAEVGVLVAPDPTVERRLLSAVLDEVVALGICRAFVLTDDSARYEQHGFRRTTLQALPEKWDRQCLRCARQPRCRQIALEKWLDQATPAIG